MQILDNMLIRSCFLLFSAFVISCGSDGEVPDLGLDYYPIDFNSYRIYDVMETTYVNKVETIENYQLRESITDAITNGENTTYLLTVERREDALDIWESIEIISVVKSNQSVRITRNNQSIINLSFPIRIGREWDGNGNNLELEQFYRYEEADEASLFSDAEHVQVVISELPPNIVEQDERFEVYARGIGLVERDYTQIQFCQQGCNSENERENGVILFQRLIEYGAL